MLLTISNQLAAEDASAVPQRTASAIAMYSRSFHQFESANHDGLAQAKYSIFVWKSISHINMSWVDGSVMLVAPKRVGKGFQAKDSVVVGSLKAINMSSK